MYTVWRYILELMSNFKLVISSLNCNAYVRTHVFIVYLPMCVDLSVIYYYLIISSLAVLFAYMRAATAAVLHEVGLPGLLLAALAAAAAGLVWPARLALAALAAQAARLLVADTDLTLGSLGRCTDSAFADRTCWVVGASQGLGEAVALRLAQARAHLVLSSRRPDALELVAARCRALGARSVSVLPFDLTCPAARQEAAARCDVLAGRRPGGLAHLFLLAGGTQRAAFASTSDAVDEAVMGLNCLSLVSLVRCCLPALIRGCGRVTLVCSAAGKMASPGQASYAGSKFALAGFAATLRAESGGTLLVTLVCPGPVASGAPGQPRLTFGSSLGHEAAPPPAAANERARLPLSRAADALVNAAGHGVREAWIARHPVLLLLFLSQYCPYAAAAILDKIGPKRTAAAAAGGDMYAVSGGGAKTDRTR